MSPFGAYDLAGNVREWLRDAPPDGPDRRLAVGGELEEIAHWLAERVR